MDIDFSKLFNEFLQNAASWVVNDLPGLIVITIVFLILFKSIKYIVRGFSKVLHSKSSDDEIAKSERLKRITTLTGIISTILKIVIVFLFVVIILEKLGVAIGPILASAGIIGLAVGFGAQELVRDMISGFFILLENQIRVGDAVELNGTWGVVESIELRTIKLRDVSGVVHVFQNGKINTLANMSKDWSAIALNIGVAYKEKYDHVVEVIHKVGADMYERSEFRDKMLEPLEVAGLNDFADSAIIIRVVIKTKPGLQWETGREFRRRLKEAFDAANIEIPFPHRTIYWGEKIDPLKLDVEHNSKAE
ncbi:MAG: mechanosensitive ion channel family protein [Brumimicrobium sp.]|nr:mechanosensitive ion channel family protein [Brumimicrobium sp.]